MATRQEQIRAQIESQRAQTGGVDPFAQYAANSQQEAVNTPQQNTGGSGNWVQDQIAYQNQQNANQPSTQPGYSPQAISQYQASRDRYEQQRPTGPYSLQNSQVAPPPPVQTGGENNAQMPPQQGGLPEGFESMPESMQQYYMSQMPQQQIDPNQMAPQLGPMMGGLSEPGGSGFAELNNPRPPMYGGYKPPMTGGMEPMPIGMPPPGMSEPGGSGFRDINMPPPTREAISQPMPIDNIRIDDPAPSPWDGMARTADLQDGNGDGIDDRDQTPAQLKNNFNRDGNNQLQRIDTFTPGPTGGLDPNMTAVMQDARLNPDGTTSGRNANNQFDPWQQGQGQPNPAAQQAFYQSPFRQQLAAFIGGGAPQGAYPGGGQGGKGGMQAQPQPYQNNNYRSGFGQQQSPWGGNQQQSPQWMNPSIRVAGGGNENYWSDGTTTPYQQGQGNQQPSYGGSQGKGGSQNVATSQPLSGQAAQPSGGGTSMNTMSGFTGAQNGSTQPTQNGYGGKGGQSQQPSPGKGGS